MQFWLVTTNHLEDKIWFKDDEDFVAGMNIPPILTATTSVQILSFILMSNHVHFVLSCSKEEAKSFIHRFKKMYSQRYWKKYGTNSLLRNNDVDIRELFWGDESLERGIAYVQMNSYAANICLNSAEYPWGTGDAFFRTQKRGGVPAGQFGVRALFRIIHSYVRLPSTYLFNERGYVDPASYVQVEFVESLYGTPKRMNYFLYNSSKAKMVKEVPSFDDQLVASGLKSLCASLFREKDYFKLSESQQSEILKQARFRFSSEPHQLARISGIPLNEVCRLLELL